jgi:uncharacterized protein HemX
MNALEFRGVGALDSPNCYGSFDFTTSIVVIIIACVLGIGWAIFNFMQVRKIDVAGDGSSSTEQLVDITEEQRKLLIELGDKIANVTNLSLRVPSSFSSRST